MNDVEFFVGEIAGLWKTTDPSTGKLACFFDRNGFDTIGLTGLVDPSEIQIRRGLSLCVAARLVRYLDASTPVYEAVRIERYRSSSVLLQDLTTGEFANMPKAVAKAVIDKYGLTAYVRLVTDKDCLDDLSGISDASRKKARSVLSKAKLTAGATALMQVFSGFKPEQAQDVYNKYGEKSVAKLQSDFYRILFDIEERWASRFTVVDGLALQNGVAADSAVRKTAAVRYGVRRVLEDRGDTSFCLDDARDMGWMLYQVNQKYLKATLVDASYFVSVLQQDNEYRIEQFNGFRVCYPKELYEAETVLAKDILRRSSGSMVYPGTVKDVRKYILEYETMTGGQLDSDQMLAVVNALLHPVYLITGGPGSGKTHVLGCILYVWYRTWAERQGRVSDCSFIMMAPTGKAAKRMQGMFENVVSDIQADDDSKRKALASVYSAGSVPDHAKVFRAYANGPARTVSSYLSGGTEFDTGLILLDEASMVGLYDMYRVFQKAKKYQIILVGDVDQLPSISPGRVFHDLIEVSGSCAAQGTPAVVSYQRLSGNYRSKGAWTMTDNNRKILAGKTLRDLDLSTPSFQFYGFDYESDDCVKKILDVYQSWLDKHYKPADIRVLAPMKKYNAGVQALNLKLQALCNPVNSQAALSQQKSSSGHRLFMACKTHGFEIPYKFAGGVICRVGDRVVQLENDYEHNIMNGDCGTIVAYVDKPGAGAKGCVIVELDDGETRVLSDKCFQNLDLGYATTVHKSQGSEYPVVIFSAQAGLAYMNSEFPSRNLLYTALTRAKESVCIVGSEASVLKCIGTPLRRRNSLLMNRIVSQS